MLVSIGDLSQSAGYPTRAHAKRTGQPVRRHSRKAGGEGVFWRPMQKQTARHIVWAAKKFDLNSKQPGARNGALGHVALEVIDLLANLMDKRTGRLEPSIDFLMQTLKRSRDAIVRALKSLRQHGFLDWLRRYVPTGNEGRGPQVKQTSNAYRLFMPQAAAKLIGSFFKQAPLPADDQTRRSNEQAEMDLYMKQIGAIEELRLDSADPVLLKKLDQLLFKLKERESAKQSESMSNNLL